MESLRVLFFKSQLLAQLVGIANGRINLTTLAASAQENIAAQKTGGPREKDAHGGSNKAAASEMPARTSLESARIWNEAEICRLCEPGFPTKIFDTDFQV